MSEQPPGLHPSEQPQAARSPAEQTTAASNPAQRLPGDAGVPARLRNRTALAAVALLLLAGVLAALGWGWPGGLTGAAGTVIGAVVVAAPTFGAAVLGRRALLWGRATRLSAGLTDGPVTAAGLPTVCGSPVPLHPARPGTPPIRTGRRLRAYVMPVRTVTGPLSGGQAVLVHARSDSLLPRPEDSIDVHALGRRGPFLLHRPEDGGVFAADRWLFSTL